MSAIDQMRAQLDQLMGTQRDGGNNKFKVSFDDPKVCKSFLLGCCPHDILSSTIALTRMDLGECPKIHDLALKADYEIASNKKDYYYDIDHFAMEHLAAFIADCDKRTDMAKRKLRETQEELSDEAASKADVILKLGEHMGTTLASAEKLGADGNVEESMKLMEQVEELKKEKNAAEAEYRNSMPASSYQQQKLRVCEVCSAFLGIHDNDRRLADHFGGKLHLGFITIRQKLEELKSRVETHSNPWDLFKNITERAVQRETEKELKRLEVERVKIEQGISKIENYHSREDRRSNSGRSKQSRSRHSRSRSRSRGHKSSRHRRHSRSSSRHRRRRSSSSHERRRKRSRSGSRSRKHHSKSKHSHQKSRSRSHDSNSQSRSKGQEHHSHTNDVKVDKANPSVEKATPSVEKATPSVEKATPSVEKATLSVEHQIENGK